MDEMEESKDKVFLGPERRSRVFKEDTRRMTAYHEAGHAVVGSYLENADPLHKVTIISRGRAGGLTSFLTDDDNYYYQSKEYLLDMITMALGGRVAEEIVIGRIGSGAYGDIKNSTNIARRMVTQWGMSEKLGPIAFGAHEEQIFLGREISNRKDYSEQTAQEIDSEVKVIISGCYEKARSILTEHEKDLHAVASALLERETLDAEDVKILLSNGTLPPMRKKPEIKKAEEQPGEAPKEAEAPEDAPEEVSEDAPEEVSEEAPVEEALSDEPGSVDQGEDDKPAPGGPADLFSDVEHEDDEPGHEDDVPKLDT
jgi:cell division protease FtsH